MPKNAERCRPTTMFEAICLCHVCADFMAQQFGCFAAFAVPNVLWYTQSFILIRGKN